MKINNSATYKLRAPTITDYAIYFTIVGLRDPKDFFINSKEMKAISFATTTALMTQFHRRVAEGTPINKIIDDMKETFDAAGGYIIPDGSNRKVNSLIHHLGLILEQHVNNEEFK